MAGRWRYFLTEPELLDEGLTDVFRIRDGAPLLTLEMAGAGVWSRSDRLYKVHFRGEIDVEFHEVDREQAAAVLQRYLDTGWFPSIPDLDAPGLDDDDAAALAAARQADEQAEAAWRDVPRPPGVDTLGG